MDIRDIKRDGGKNKCRPRLLRPPMPRQLAVALLCFALLGAAGWMISDLWFKGYLIGRQRMFTTTVLSTKGYALSAAIARKFALMGGLQAFTVSNASAPDFGDRFKAYAPGLHAGANGVRLFAIAPGGVIRYLYPMEGNEGAAELDLFRDANTREDAVRTLQTRGVTLSNPYQLRQGGLGMVARSAVTLKGRFWGFATMVLDVPSIITEAGLDRLDRFKLALRDHSGKVFYGEAKIFDQAPILLRIDLPEGHWTLAGIPRGGWEAPITRELTIFRVAVLFVALCLAFIIFEVYDRQQRLRDAVRERTQALQETENYNRALFELSPTGLVLCRMDGVLVDVNPAFAAILGRDVAETLQLTYWEVTPERYAEQEQSVLASLEKTGCYGPFEKEYLRKDGTLVPVRLQGRIIERNQERYIWSSVEDITDQKRAEAQIKREHDFAEVLIDSLPGVVYLYDEEFNFLRWNKNFELVTGYTAEEIRHLTPLDFFAGAEKELLQDRINEVFAAGASAVEANFVSKSGASTPYFFTGLRTRIDDKNCLIGIGIDISQRKRLEQELTALNVNLEARVTERTKELQESRQALVTLVQDLNEKSAQLVAANEKLKEIDRLKSMFIASMSHELRTPLNSVIGYSSIILDEWLGPLQPQQKENLAIVLRAGKHLLSLINDVIDVSKIEAGQIDVHKEEFDLFELVAEAAKQVEADIVGKGLAFLVDNIHIRLTTDRRRLLQALLNLLSNAMKYTVEGSVHVAVQQTGAWLHVAVADTGIGIDDEAATLIFQPFQRVNSPLRGTVPGTGLGLYLTRKLVEEVLGGTITFASTPGRGSTFTIRVPAPPRELRGEASCA